MEAIEKNYENEITCPYCSYEFEDSWEFLQGYDEDSDVFDCDECGKKFYASKNVEVTYSSKGLCKENNTEHTWEEFDNTHDDGKRYKGRRCLVCGEHEFDINVHPDIGVPILGLTNTIN